MPATAFKSLAQFLRGIEQDRLRPVNPDQDAAPVFGREFPRAQESGDVVVPALGFDFAQAVGHPAVQRRVALLRRTNGFETVRGEQHGQFEAVRQFRQCLGDGRIKQIHSARAINNDHHTAR